MAKTKTQAIVATLDEVPVTAALLEVIPLRDDVRRWIHVVFAEDDQKTILKCLGKGAVIDYGEVPPAIAKLGDVLEDARALNRTLKGLFDVDGGPMNDARSAMLPDVARSAVKALLEGAGFDVLSYADILRGRPGCEDEASALARAVAPFEEHFSPEVAAAADKYFRGPSKEVPPALLDAKSEYYETPAGLIDDALGGEVERWHPEVASRVLDFWMAARPPEVTPLSLMIHLGSGNDPQPELGFNRARVIAAELERRGLDPVLAACAAKSCVGESTSYHASSLFLRLEALDKAASTHREIARQVAHNMVYALLDESPSMRRHFDRLLATKSWALGVKALDALATTHAAKIEREHLEKAAVDCSVNDLLNMGATLTRNAPDQCPNGPRQVLEIWLRVTPPDQVLTELQRALERDADLVDSELVWDWLLTRLEANGMDAFPKARAKMEEKGFSDMTGLVSGIGKANAATKKRITALCDAQRASLGRHYAVLIKYGAPQKLPPMPYEEADLDGLPTAQAKAWATARKKSWAAGLKLPKGASAKQLDAVAKVMGAPLPDDVRSFYALHDGAGPDEVFQGCQLYSMKEALERRKFLREVDGAPFDEKWLPLTDDGGGNHQCVVMKGKQAGFIVDFDHESGGGRVLSKSFASFVANASWGE